MTRFGALACPLLATVLAIATSACAALRPIIADDADFADYAKFRVAAYEGTRLARALDYLDAHPDGAWAADVRGVFAEEEPLYFESAKRSRARALDYLTSLPRGPHVEQAMSLLISFDVKVEDVETARLLRDARRTEATLDRASNQRREVGERILADVAAMLDERVYGSTIDDAPAPLRRALGGAARNTWGRLPARREEDLFFTLPTRPERQSRLVTLVVAVEAPRGRILETRLEGADLFLGWTEADTMGALDPTSVEDRALAATHAKELLAGAFEARLPEAKCSVPPGGDALLERACDGWSLIVKMAPAGGGTDAIVVRGRSVGK